VIEMNIISVIKDKRKTKEGDERERVFLSTIANKPLKIQVEQYNNVISKNKEKLIAKYDKHNISNSKLRQLFEIQKLDDTIKSEMQMRELSRSYTEITLAKISPSKQRQYHERYRDQEEDNASDNLKYNRQWQVPAYKKARVWFYTAAEWVMEDWSSKHGLEYYDFNEINQRAPRDCKIANIDIDVKTTTEVGMRSIKIFSRHKRDIESKEIVVGLSSNATDYKLKSSNHYIYGVFDPRTFDLIDSPLYHLKPNSTAITPCSFQAIEEYFHLIENKQPKPMLVDEEVLEYLIELNTCFPAIVHSLGSSPDKLDSFLRQTVAPMHHDFIPVVLELVEKQLISLLPNYLADYLIRRIISKEPIDNKSISNVFYKIYRPNVDQRTYIDSLIKIQEVIPKVRCRWHPDEGMEEMKMTCFIGSFIPTFVAHCSHNHLNKTTFYTYNWKNGQQIAYGDTNTKSCDSPGCGCLTVEHMGQKVGRRNCIKYGEEALNKREADRRDEQLEWQFFGLN